MNPLKTIGAQIVETVLLHHDVSKDEAHKRAIHLLMDVGINEPERRAKQYPHEFSGGTRQRVVIAIALACNPRILICDEPTTALDVTIQAQILQLIRNLQKKYQLTTIYITHDLGVVAEAADDVGVMYAGELVEQAPVHTFFARPLHPYAHGLMSCAPTVDNRSQFRLTTISGSVPAPSRLPKGCTFRPRCPRAFERCGQVPPMLETETDHFVRCWLYI